MLIALSGTKGAPGVTTTCLALAAIWHRDSTVLLVEADPDGGALAARLGLSQEPGIGTLAVAGRHDLSIAALDDHAQAGPASVPVIVAPSSPIHIRAALRAVARSIGRCTAAMDGNVIVDLGRLDTESPSLALAAAAGRVIFLARPTIEGVDALAVRLGELVELRSRAGLVTVGEGPYSGEEIAEVLSIVNVGHLPYDTGGASAVLSGAGNAFSGRRPLLRALVSLADRLGTDPIQSDSSIGDRSSGDKARVPVSLRTGASQ